MPKGKVISSKVVYKTPWLTIREDQISSKEKPYSVIQRAHGSIIIPISPSGKTVLLKQFRYPTKKYSWELPMGGTDPGEKPKSAAIRELKEETNLDYSSLTLIGKFHPAPGLTSQEASVFVVKVSDHDLERVKFSSGDDDIVDIKVIQLEKVYQMVSTGKITDGFTLVALSYLKQSKSYG